MAFIASTAGRVDITIALAPFLVIHCRQVIIAPFLALELHRAVRRGSAAPSITVHSPSCCPSPPIAVVLSVHPRRARTVPRRRGAVAPTLTIKEPSRRPMPSRSCRAVHCCQGAAALSLAVKKLLAVLTDDSGHSSCSPKPLVRLVVALSLLTPPPPNCRRLSLRSLPFVPLVHPAGCPISSLLSPPPPICQCLRLSSRRRLLLSCLSRASRPAG